MSYFKFLILLLYFLSFSLPLEAMNQENESEDSEKKPVFHIRSTGKEDFEKYEAFLSVLMDGYLSQEGLLRKYFFSHNLERQMAGIPYHLYRVSEITEGSDSEKLLGFLHLGRRSTFATEDQRKRWESNPDYPQKLYRLWVELEILEKKDKEKGFEESNLRRIESRGLAHLLPVLDPTLDTKKKAQCIQVGYGLICHFAEEGCSLLPEESPSGSESTLPYQVIAFCDPNEDSLVDAFRLAGFVEKAKDVYFSGAFKILFVRKVDLVQ
ncbi:MAG: hypothetical protein ACD_16C00231G0001 [uncultured bacterium]|nr:MAG: hypothetical protein ACD_16C00231G0001 [uncultured bacterium]OFW69881.1 MAG: hypothetical protein A2X70_04240 [Alphaproteobacteria bacterium GWC2_42_16]OFW73092.1 MAG: hypothetical protein A2Z80_00195 [Alphaproteobacteria bacterium GWA2_41_27]OFW81666.1 MAG: hypothetical protein A3E50_00195 [Alphaproteobacteria bacterium RIFCSPHIGHO2_12_FULL_42_100]OFW85308.1 MAG: hypothetical protein A2W06_00320 [Alphaproteobacteria bacterium RBG_16_42_14]OFW90566.1 MAG: hypothetical protein A3C41_027